MKDKCLSIEGLQGQVAIVTGGASGIGEGICHAFASNGIRVGIADVDGAKAAEAVEGIRGGGGQAIAAEVDVADNPAVQAAVQRVIKEFGTVNILVNCAGINTFAAPHEIPFEDWDRLMRVNLYGPWNFCRAVIPEMMKNGRGKIINIASAAGLLGIPKASPYSTSKHGMVGLTKSLAVDLGPHDVNVNCICPSTIETPLLARATKPAFAEGMRNRIPMGRLGKLSDIANAALFLASWASDWITGAILPVDGGLTCCVRAHHFE